jgi:DNA-binding response OmpR family regulator
VSRTQLLIVEDSALAASALRLLFEESGYDVAVAHDIPGAVETAVALAPDVMLLDLTLPDGDGLAVLQRLRAARVPVPRTIVLTGHDDADVRQRCVEAGCEAVLLKPAPIAQLLALVRST